MKMIESSDGTVKVIELDPTKWYLLVIDDDAGIQRPIRKVDGAIIYKRPNTTITFVENPERVTESPT